MPISKTPLSCFMDFKRCTSMSKGFKSLLRFSGCRALCFFDGIQALVGCSLACRSRSVGGSQEACDRKASLHSVQQRSYFNGKKGNHRSPQLKKSFGVFLLLVASLVLGCSTAPTTQPTASADASGPLYQAVLALDKETFAAFNNCAAPGQLQKHAQFFAEDVEFYHDKGGVTWTRAQMLANTEKYVCGNFSRQLVEGSFRVYPIKDFGAIAQGVHKFCQFKSGACEGAAEFLIVWRQQGNQ